MVGDAVDTEATEVRSEEPRSAGVRPLSRRLHDAGFVVGGLVDPPAHRVRLHDLVDYGLKRAVSGPFASKSGFTHSP